MLEKIASFKVLNRQASMAKELLAHRKAKKISDEALAFYSDNNYEYKNFAFICQEHISAIMKGIEG